MLDKLCIIFTLKLKIILNSGLIIIFWFEEPQRAQSTQRKASELSSRAHSPPFIEVIAPGLYYEPPHRTGLEDFPHPALQKHILYAFLC
ncbi:MAG: hypothetical protein OIN84_14385, partial [Candidatus Methanoperedens sp.]|nr:hypothetical protein [Candidatus Methanoperedens sp.]